ASDRWFIGFAQVLGAKAVRDTTGTHYVGTPSIARTKPDGDVEHVGGICTFGIFCSVVPNANRSLADSIAIALDPSGGANLVWTNDTSASSRIDFACQSSGASALAGLKPLHGCYRP